ncbi:ATP-binding cassette domain-containing protein [Streptomyces sp. NPDC090022]|uniref:ABC transporter ATP-binding protein n=1 Tax=Streptomyces sp. NPDC090022 TaxID=3365920 RepID=UPI0038238E06
MRLTGVGHRHGARGPWVLRDVDLELPPATLVRVEGGNGGGKSTLLRLIAGADTPAVGRITGRPRRTAYVPERFPPALPLTVGAYLAHLGRIQGLTATGAAERAAYWLERFGAGDRARTPLADLSKGSSQKVAVAQALLAAPALLVLDEAWTGLDTAARAELDQAVAERTADGATVVFVDHDPRRLAGRCDARYRVGGAALAPVRPDDDRGPYLTIDALGPPGSAPPAALPDGLPVRPAAGGGVRLTVPAARSDAVLRVLLTADPPWHIRGVAAVEDRR